jgi:hypothetical protein
MRQQNRYTYFIELSKSLTYQKRYPEAEVAMQQAVSISGHDEWTWRHLSWLQSEQGKFEDAIPTARRALSLKETPEGYFDLCRAALGAHEFAIVAEASSYAISCGRAACGSRYNSFLYYRDRCSPKEYVLTDVVLPSKARLVKGEKAKRILRVPQDALPYQSGTTTVKGALEFSVRPEADLKIIEVLPAGNTLFTISSTLKVRPHSFKERIRQYRSDAVLPTEIKLYLGETENIVIGSKVKQFAPTLRGRDDLATIGNIRSWFLSRFKYAGDGGGSVEEIFTRCTGHCDSIARLCTALCRVNGIAARPVRMNWGGDKQNDQAMWHSVIEVYIRGGGWVAFDPHNKSFGDFPNVYWPNNAIRLHYYPAGKDIATWVEHARPNDSTVPRYSFRLLNGKER